MTNKNTNTVQSFAKGLRVLECFGAQTTRLSITDVANATGFDRATARRCLLTLHVEGYADYDGKFFSLTPRVMRLGMGAIAALPLTKIVQPWLDQLAEKIGQSCSVSILDECDIVYIARAAQQRVMSVGLMPGSRLPAYCTSMGRVLLSGLPVDEIREVIAASDLTPRSPTSLTEPNDIIAAILDVQQQQYAFIDQEVEGGLRSIAVPLRDSRGRVVAALNAGMAATHRHANEVIAQYLPELQKAQAGIERILL